MSAFFPPSASPHFSFSAPILPRALSRSVGSSGGGGMYASPDLAPSLNLGALWTRVPLVDAAAAEWDAMPFEEEVAEPELVMPHAYKRCVAGAWAWRDIAGWC